MACARRWTRRTQRNSRKLSSMLAGSQTTPVIEAQQLVPVPFAKFFGYFRWLGAPGFGVPIALAGYMQRGLVERRRWVSREDYLEGLALAQLAPGPLAAQLAIYLGYLRAGTLGASVVGLAFIGPSFLMVLAIASAYVRYGGCSWVRPRVYGTWGAGGRVIWRLERKIRPRARSTHALVF